MKRYRLSEDKPAQLRDEEIQKHKDFKRLIYRYEEVTTPLYQKPLYKQPKVFLGLVLVVIILWLILASQEEESPKQEPTDPVEQVD